MHWQRVWTVWIMRLMALRPLTKAIPIMGSHTTPDHMTIPSLKSIVLTCDLKAVAQWKFHRHHDCLLQAIYRCQVLLCRTQRQET